MPKTTPHLSWDEEMVKSLLKIVIVNGAHLASRGTVTAKWNEVNDNFFRQEEYDYLEKDHYVPGEYRKLQDKYKSVIKEVKQNMETGNKSGQTGELSELYLLVKQIYDDIDEMEELKGEASARKRRLNEHEQTLLFNNEIEKPNHGWGRRKLLDGSIVESTGKGSSKSTPNFNDTMLELVQRKMSQEGMSHVNVRAVDEDVIKEQMLQWIDSTHKNVFDLLSLEEGDVEGEKALSILRKISLKAIISLYCTRGLAFKAEFFYDKMDRLSISFLYALQIYSTLEEWRKDGTAPTKEYSTPQNYSNSNGNN